MYVHPRLVIKVCDSRLRLSCMDKKSTPFHRPGSEAALSITLVENTLGLENKISEFFQFWLIPSFRHSLRTCSRMRFPYQQPSDLSY